MSNIMSPDHPDFKEFGERLWIAVDPSECDHATTRHTEAILDAMGADTAASLQLFHSLSGECDCTILLNIVRP